MYNADKVIVGILVLIIFFTTPFWLNYKRVEALPKPERAEKGEKCIEDTAYMRAYHMKLLDEWRNEKVRESKIYYQSSDGRIYLKSLQRTCMECHRSMANFCDRCHTMFAVKPDCWKCHIAPEEVKKWR